MTNPQLKPSDAAPNLGRFADIFGRIDDRASPIASLRKEAFRKFSLKGLPTRSWEEWKYTQARGLLNANVVVNGAAASDKNLPSILDLAKDGNAHCIVFVDGRAAMESSELSHLPQGVVVQSMAQALAESPEVIRALLERDEAHERHPFALLNQAFFDDGVYIEVAKNVCVEKPIIILNFQSEREQRDSTKIIFQKNLIVASEGSQLTVIEANFSRCRDVTFCPTTQLSLSANARVEHATFIEQSVGASSAESVQPQHICVLRANLNRDASLTSHAFATGGFIRADIDLNLSEPGSSAEMYGVILGGDADHIDFHTTVNHAAPHAKSHQIYKNTLAGKSKAVFNGKVLVREGAAQTDAQQLNKTLLLSPNAEIATKPELQIDNDDVRCSHGAAIGQLNRDELFYCASRGIPKNRAIELVSMAFIDELLLKISHAPFRAFAHQRAQQFLAQKAAPETIGVSL